MTANSFGSRFVIHSFGESHGSALGVLIDGCPAGLEMDFDLLKSELERRRPGIYSTDQIPVSPRVELDEPEILSGVFEGKTLGTPIAIIIKNKDQKSSDYKTIENKPRTGHADDTWKQKFGHTDFRGGGRSSGRETVARVMGGAVARMLLQKVSPPTKVEAFVSRVENTELNSAKDLQKIKSKLDEAQKNGESFGAEITLNIQNPPTGLGQPVFHKLKSDLAAAMMSVGAVTGVELGAGFSATKMKGTKFHDKIKTTQYGGIRGGISTGETITLKIAIKPTSSILDIAKQGRHDPCIAIRAVPVLESMAVLVLADHILWARQDRV